MAIHTASDAYRLRLGLGGTRCSLTWFSQPNWQYVTCATDTDVEVLMTRTVPPVLVTGATGQVGCLVVDLLVDGGVPVRALTRRPEAAAMLPEKVEASEQPAGDAGGGAVTRNRSG